jgi:hypothetical protein
LVSSQVIVGKMEVERRRRRWKGMTKGSQGSG